MLRIGEFSQMGQVSIRTLRHYDELGLLKPVHIDRFTDYRYYAVEQLPTLNRILALKDLGFSLEQIAHLLKENVPVSQLRGMLTLKQAEVEQQLQAEQARLRRIEARLKQIEQEGKVSEYEVVLKQVPEQLIASKRQIIPSIPDMAYYRCQMYLDVYTWLARQQITPLAPEIALYHAMEYVEQNIDTELGAIVNKSAPSSTEQVHIHELPALPMAASVIHQGALFDVVQAMVALFTWISANGYTSCGAVRELHLQWRENDIEDFGAIILELQIPIARQ